MSTQKHSHDDSAETDDDKSNSSKRIRRSGLNATQISNCRSTTRSGKILMVTLENFMCHVKLKFEFHNRINFIVGSNGSGKSAIMTAIVLVFGGNARATNRSTNIRKFIKTGETTAKIEVELENSGAFAYKSDIYGSKIIIRRIIRHTGSSAYSLKDCNGKVISTRLDDLRHMVEFFGIRVVNPIFMLNQDKAREFLRELDRKKNYELFLNASQLDVAIGYLSDSQKIYVDQKNQFGCIEKQIERENMEKVEMERKLEHSTNIDKMKEEIKKMEISYAWSSVVILEKEMTQMEEIIKKIEDKCNSLQFALTKDNLTETLKQQLIEKNASLAELQEEYNESDSSLYKAKDEVNHLNDQLRIIRSNIASYMKCIDFEKVELAQLDAHMRNIDDIKNKAVELIEINKQQIQNLNKKREENKVVLENARRDLVMLHNNLVQMREKKSEMKQETDIFLKKINKISGHVSTLKATSCNKVALVADIEEMYREGKFSEMPRGPVDSYIKVPNEKYRNIVEHVLKSRLHSFIVNSDEDRFTLNELIKNKHPHIMSPIITTRFTKQVYNVAKRRVNPPPNTTLLMDEINCSDPVVLNVVIDTKSIETVLITDSMTIAEELTANIENVPPNVTRVMVPKVGLEYVAAPHYAIYSLRIGMAANDVNERIRQLLVEKNAAEQKANIAQNQLREINRNLEDHDMKYKEKRSLIATRDQSFRQILEQREELENFVYPHVPDFVILQNEYKGKELKIQEYNEKLVNEQVKLDAFLSVKDEKVRNMEDIKKFLQEHENRKQQERKDFENVQLQLRNVDYTMKRNDRKLNEIKDLLHTKETELQEKKKIYDKKKSLALAKGEYIPTDRTEKDLMKEIKSLQWKIQYENLGTEGREQLALKLAQKKEHLEKQSHKLKEIKATMVKLSHEYQTRQLDLNRLRKQVSTFVMHVFNSLCKYRYIDACLTISHDKRTIDIEVTPQANQQVGNHRMSMTRVLSGGERSFITVALLMAIWSASKHPFYFLDEYNVFTDEVYRHYITKMLIENGKQNPNQQYFFLTSQDTTIEESDAIKIHKLAAPERT